MGSLVEVVLRSEEKHDVVCVQRITARGPWETPLCTHRNFNAHTNYAFPGQSQVPVIKFRDSSLLVSKLTSFFV